MSLINILNIFCDKKCSQNKVIKELYDNYEIVKEQLQDEVDSSKSYYPIYLSTDTTTSSVLKKTEIINKIMNTFDISIQNIKSRIETYKGNMTDLNKTLELYNLYYEKNNEVLLKFNDYTTKTLTDERNSYYENESSTSKTFYNNILKYSYIVLLILFSVFLYSIKTVLTRFTIIIIIILFIIFPFLFYTILKSLHLFIENMNIYRSVVR